MHFAALGPTDLHCDRVRPRWVRWPVITLALLDAGWMTFDGVRALAIGDYVTVDGKLGPGPMSSPPLGSTRVALR